MSQQINDLIVFSEEQEITCPPSSIPALGTSPEIVTLPAPQDLYPPIRRLGYYLDNPPERPPELIEGLLHQGSKLVLGGSSKSYKTWTLIDLGLSVAAGVPWWGWQTVEKKVLYLNFEVQEAFFWSRIQSVLRGKQIEAPTDDFHIWPLRGFSEDLDKMIAQINTQAQDEGYGLLVVDPLYKIMGMRDENSATDIASLMNGLDRLARQTGAAVVFGSHFAKGNAANKESIDRMSGSGVIARDPDSILTLTKHEQDDCYTVEATLRNFPKVDPFVLQWEMPLMVRQETLDPSKLKKTGGRQAIYHLKDLLGHLTTTKPSAEWMREVMESTGMSERKFYDLKRQLIADRRVVQEGKNCSLNLPIV